MVDLSNAKKIHDGKFSQVFLAEKGPEKFIIKQLHPRLGSSVEAILKFKAEATLPYIEGVSAKILDFEELNGNYFIVKEYLPGYTLKQLQLKYGRKKYQGLFVKLCIVLCQKLSELHAAGILHCDIKPGNILFYGNDFKKDAMDVRLLDMGMALMRNKLPEKNKNARLPFSMLYSAPELMLNEPAYISELTDLFSVGVCMYETFASEVPYKENHAAILLQMMLALPFKKQKRIPDKIFDLISKTTQKPAFMRPAAQYSVEEALLLLKASLVKRLVIPSAKSLEEELKKT